MIYARHIEIRLKSEKIVTEEINFNKKTSPKSKLRACNFTAIINTNHQRKNFHSEDETFLYNRRMNICIVTPKDYFNEVL